MSVRIVRRPDDTTKAMIEKDEKYFRQVVEPLAVHVAQHFSLDLKSVEHKKFGRPSDESLVLGLCYPNQKRIRVLIRPFYNGKFCERLKEELIIRTVAHELAHLRHADHSKAHTDFTEEIFNFIWHRKDGNEKS